MNVPRKFITEFGLVPFYESYVPQLKRLGVEHLPGISWEWDEKKENVRPDPSQIEKFKHALDVGGGPKSRAKSKVGGNR